MLRYRGRSGLIQRDFGARTGVSLRAVQAWEAGVAFPTSGRLQALVQVLLEAGVLTPGQEMSEARELFWDAARLREELRAEA